VASVSVISLAEQDTPPGKKPRSRNIYHRSMMWRFSCTLNELQLFCVVCGVMPFTQAMELSLLQRYFSSYNESMKGKSKEVLHAKLDSTQ
jgi:hypothetical protein